MTIDTCESYYRPFVFKTSCFGVIIYVRLMMSCKSRQRLLDSGAGEVVLSHSLNQLRPHQSVVQRPAVEEDLRKRLAPAAFLCKPTSTVGMSAYY